MGDMDPQETPPFKVSRRGNADMSGAPVQVNVPGEVANQEKTQGKRAFIIFLELLLVLN